MSSYDPCAGHHYDPYLTTAEYRIQQTTLELQTRRRKNGRELHEKIKAHAKTYPRILKD